MCATVTAEQCCLQSIKTHDHWVLTVHWKSFRRRHLSSKGSNFTEYETVYSFVQSHPTSAEAVSCSVRFPHLGQSRSGQSRELSPHCPCVSSRSLLGRGLWVLHCPPATQAGAGGASALAPGTPAGTGSSCPTLQVSARRTKWVNIKKKTEQTAGRKLKHIEEVKLEEEHIASMQFNTWIKHH